MNTRIHYLYRDASNYKQGGIAVLSGEPDEQGIAAITAALEDEGHFIPSQVGLRDLQRDLSAELYDDDHVWHEIDPAHDITPTNDAPTESFSFADLVARFGAVTWDVERAVIEVGLGEDEHEPPEPTRPLPPATPVREGDLRSALSRRGVPAGAASQPIPGSPTGGSLAP